MSLRPVIFDFDGVLVDTELMWSAVRRDVALAHGGRWHERASSEMQGLSTAEWARYMVGRLGVELPPQEVARRVIAELQARVGDSLPFLEGAQQTVRRLAGDGRPLAVASSSPRQLLDSMLTAGGIRACFKAVVSSEEVANGKPSPDVYLEAARRLGVTPSDCLAVEDSTNGLRAAAAAGMEVYAFPNPHDPPTADALALAGRVLTSVADLVDTYVGRGCG
jgi:HAD superfamily hydrolase (TIGR01509 family)